MRVLAVSSTFFCLLAFAFGAGAQPLPAQQTELTGLTSVRIELLLIGEAQSIGLSEQDLTEAVADRLRRAGLAVRGSDDDRVRGDPRLRVAIQAANAVGGYAFLVSVQFVERVITYRRYVELVVEGILPTAPADSVEPLKVSSGIKWESQALGTTSRANAVRFIPDALLGYVDRFLEDYGRIGAP